MTDKYRGAGVGENTHMPSVTSLRLAGRCGPLCESRGRLLWQTRAYMVRWLRVALSTQITTHQRLKKTHKRRSSRLGPLMASQAGSGPSMTAKTDNTERA